MLTLGGVYVRARLFVDHRCINVFIHVLNFHGLNCEIILTAKFSLSTVFLFGFLCNVVAIINMAAYIHGCLLFIVPTVIHKITV